MAIDVSSVPGSSQKMLDKVIGLSVDSVAYDLEDSVTLSKKAEARSNLRGLLSQPRPPGIKEQGVRINAVESGLALDDLTEVVLEFNLCVLAQLIMNLAQSATYRHHRDTQGEFSLGPALCHRRYTTYFTVKT